MALSNIVVGLGWLPSGIFSSKIDLDLSACLLQNGRFSDPLDTVTGDKKNREKFGAVIHSGDSKSGSTRKGDNEQITASLNDLPPNYDGIVFTATIHKSAKRGQFFEDVNQAYIRIEDTLSGQELLRCNLSSQRNRTNAFIFCAAVKKPDGWEIKPLMNALQADSFEDLLWKMR